MTSKTTNKFSPEVRARAVRTAASGQVVVEEDANRLGINALPIRRLSAQPAEEVRRRRGVLVQRCGRVPPRCQVRPQIADKLL